MDVELW